MVFRDSYEQAWDNGYRNLTPANRYNVDYSMLGTARVEPLLRRIRNAMMDAEMRVENSKGECNFGQHEINFLYGPALRTADDHVIYKNGAKEIAAQEGKSITYMAKYDEREGNSCHIHLSLRDRDGTPLFGQDDASLLEHFIAGQLATLRDLTLFLAPNVNSYKRFAVGSFAPTAVAWGVDNRTCALRVVGHGPSRRVECRLAGRRRQPVPRDRRADRRRPARRRPRARRSSRAFEGNAYLSDKPRVPTTLREASRAVRREPGRARGVRRRGRRRTTSTTRASSSTRSTRPSPTGSASAASSGSDGRLDFSPTALRSLAPAL